MINASIAAGYVLDSIQGMSIFIGTIFKTIATNDTVANRTAEDIYYLFGFLKYFSDFLSAHVYYVYNNTTTMQYSVEMWQKIAKNSTVIFGDFNATEGLAHIWKLGYNCIQPGNYCESKGPETTYWVLQMIKWIYTALGKVGKNLSVIYS